MVGYIGPKVYVFTLCGKKFTRDDRKDPILTKKRLTSKGD